MGIIAQINNTGRAVWYSFGAKNEKNSGAKQRNITTVGTDAEIMRLSTARIFKYSPARAFRISQGESALITPLVSAVSATPAE